MLPISESYFFRKEKKLHRTVFSPNQTNKPRSWKANVNGFDQGSGGDMCVIYVPQNVLSQNAVISANFNRQQKIAALFRLLIGVSHLRFLVQQKQNPSTNI